MIVNMSCTSTVSLSLEGKNLWIIQSLPISSKILFQSKMLFNMIVVLPFSPFCIIVFMLGMCAAIHFPKFEWENEIEVIKQSASSTMGVFSSMIGYLVLTVITYILSMVIPGEIVLFVLAAILGFVTFLLYGHVVRQKINV